MDKNLLIRSEELFKQLDRISKFGSKYNEYPYKDVGTTVDDMRNLAESIPNIDQPNTQDELIQSELKRRLNGEASGLEHMLVPRRYDFDTIIDMYGIPRADIEELENWLKANKESTQNAIERLYNTKNIENYELSLPVDIPHIRRQAEEFAGHHIKKYHKRLGKLLQDLTKVGEFLRDIDAVPTTEIRSYFHPLTKTLAIGIPAICFFTERGDLQIREKDLITIYGHEGMGHALNKVITSSSGLPYFLTKETILGIASMESVAQFYQDIIFEDLKKSPKVQEDLGIKHKFGRICQEVKDIAKIGEYKKKLSNYIIKVLADKRLGDHDAQSTIEKKIELLSKVTLSPAQPLSIVEHYRLEFDSKSNLKPEIVSELRYCAQPVARALQEFKKQGITYEGEGRSIIDQTFLNGFWTPIGFVDNARIRAKQNYSLNSSSTALK